MRGEATPAGRPPQHHAAFSTSRRPYLLMSRSAQSPLELPTVNLEDALAILPVIAREEPTRYDRAACRWLARFALERKVGLEEIGVALAALDQLPDRPSASTILKRMIGRSTS